MAEPTIVCPQCKIEIMLTESLAAPLLASIRRDYEQRLAQKDLDIAKRERAMEARAQSLDKAKAEIEAQVSRKLEQERARIVAEEAQRARVALASELDQKTKEIINLQEILKVNDAKLAKAQKAQAEVLRK